MIDDHMTVQVRRGMPENLSWLYFCALLPPMKVALARTEKVTPSHREYWKRLRLLKRTTPFWRIHLKDVRFENDDLSFIEAASRSLLVEYGLLAKEYGDPYIEAWVAWVIEEYDNMLERS